MPLAPLFLLIALASPATQPTSRPGGNITPPPHRDVPGRRIVLPHGQLFIPDFYQPAGRLDLVIFFLSPPWLAEQNFHDARKNALLFTANPATTKSGFPTPESFDALLAEIQSALPNNKPLGHLTLVSFSGGYTALRDILRHDAATHRVTDVLLLDSLYAPRTPPDSNTLSPDAMKPFLDYAARAASAQCTLTFTQLYPPEEKYRSNTTTLAASYLIDHLHLSRTVNPTTNPSPSRTLLYRADQAGLHILGYAGMTNQDHFDHLYQSADLLKLLPLPDAK